MMISDNPLKRSKCTGAWLQLFLSAGENRLPISFDHDDDFIMIIMNIIMRIIFMIMMMVTTTDDDELNFLLQTVPCRAGGGERGFSGGRCHRNQYHQYRNHDDGHRHQSCDHHDDRYHHRCCYQSGHNYQHHLKNPDHQNQI